MEKPLELKRVISLIASATEIVCALGKRDWLLGRSHECDYPPSVLSLPPLTEAKLDVHGSSLEVDRQVKTLLKEGLSVYRVDVGLLREIDPDVIVTQDQCEVCAASLADVEAAMCNWTGREVNVVSLRPNGLDDVFADIERVALALGCPEDGLALVEGLMRRMQNVVNTCAGLPQPTVACIEWIEPLMAAGNWVPELVAMAGGRNLLGVAGQHSPWMTWEQLQAVDPDVIAIMPCGYDMPRVLAEMHPLLAQPGWADLRAVRNGRVHVTDGNQYFNRPGPRLADSLEIMAEMLHPGLCDFGHRGTGWTPFVGPA